MIETFLKRNWRTVILIGVVLFAWFVWPTLYFPPFTREVPNGGEVVLRANRVTGAVEEYWSHDGKWRPWTKTVFEATKKSLSE